MEVAAAEGADADDGQVGLHRRRQRRGGHAGQPRVLGLHGRIDCARPLRIGDGFRGELAKDYVTASKLEAGGRTRRTSPVDESRTIRRHDHVAGVKVAFPRLPVGVV